jgi:hypothetical protein
MLFITPMKGIPHPYALHTPASSIPKKQAKKNMLFFSTRFFL